MATPSSESATAPAAPDIGPGGGGGGGSGAEIEALPAPAKAAAASKSKEQAGASSALPASSASVNINVGVLGHVDSGKTSLVRALSTELSTAALDKNPQSKERGITLDLGFSAFITDVPEHLADGPFGSVQYTLVDCPGHASLIKTIIGGAQIIDRMLLVVDVTKGIQTQTAECLVIGEILTDDLVVVLNKVDLVPPEQRAAKIREASAAITKALATTRFRDSPVLPVAAMVGGDGKAGVGDSDKAKDGLVESLGLADLVDHLKRSTRLPDRGADENEPLYFAIDHCFPLKGQGTVLTGTVLGGTVSVGDKVAIPQLQLERQVKSIQMFKRPVQMARKGDRAAVRLTDLKAKLLERGVVTSPGSLTATMAAIALVRRVRYFPLECASGSKLHVTVGHATTLAKVTFFGTEQLRGAAASAVGKELPAVEFDGDEEFLYDETLKAGGKAQGGPVLQWALLQFEQPIICQAGSMLVASRLDLNVDTKSCRLAFYGRVARKHTSALSDEELIALKVYKLKERAGTVDRIADKDTTKDNKEAKPRSFICKGMFSKDTDLHKFVGLKVATKDAQEQGRIESAFGKTGKFNVFFPAGAKLAKGDKVFLRHKRMLFATPADRKKLLQD